MSPNPIMGEQPIDEASKSFKQGMAAGLGMRIFSEVAVSNIAWLLEDAERRGITPGKHLNVILDAFQVMQHAIKSDPNREKRNVFLDRMLADLPTAEERACPVCGDDFKGFPDDKRCPTCQKALEDASDDAQVTP